ncbi:MAG: hypothetical protein ACOCTI_05810 [Phycisphaeraceae bacterium]
MSQTHAPSTTAPAVTGRIDEISDQQIVLEVLGTDYRLHLVPVGRIAGEKGDRVTGVIRLQARRVDVVPSGGRFVEPVFGRPRRLQGRVLGGDLGENTLFLHCGAPVVAKLSEPQQARDFAVGQMVSFDALAGASFETA